LLSASQSNYLTQKLALLIKFFGQKLDCADENLLPKLE